ncbi:ABC transporter ATP-binding protein [Arenimonas sp.]|uniref:ABC transporter ATP-binding protein n=1 Tax=Arenimonas sp. TaxID=1872635 RepID=UPI0035B34729
METALHTHQLSRRFRGGQGVHELDLSVPAGAIYGFLGPNGAGKTTTIRLLLGLLRPDGGEVHLLGERLLPGRRTALARVGALVEHPSLYPHLDGRANLEVTRRLLGLPARRVDEVLERIGLVADAHRRVREYSLGMRQRLGIGLALLARPRLLVLDEPGNGLDPAGTQALRRFLRELVAQEGLTLFLSSHQLGEVEQLASHVGVLDQGRLRFQGTLAELRERARPALLLRCDSPARAIRVLVEAGEDPALAEGHALRLNPRLPPAEINRRLVAHGIAVQHLALEPVTLESLFFELTAPGAREVAA